MQAAFDLAQTALVSSPGQLSPFTGSITRARGNEPSQIQFCRGSIPVALLANTEVRLGVKDGDNLKGPMLAESDSLTLSGTIPGLYTGNLPLNTPGVRTAMHAEAIDPTPELAAYPCVLFLFFKQPGDSDWTQSQLVPLNITAPGYNGDEILASDPAAAWPTQAALATAIAEAAAAEPGLGAPAADISILASLVDKTRSWLATSALGRTVLNVADAAAARATLGLGSAALAALDTDPALSANSDTRVPSQAAVMAYVQSSYGTNPPPGNEPVGGGGLVSYPGVSGLALRGLTTTDGSTILVADGFGATGYVFGPQPVLISGDPSKACFQAFGVPEGNFSSNATLDGTAFTGESYPTIALDRLGYLTIANFAFVAGIVLQASTNSFAGTLVITNLPQLSYIGAYSVTNNDASLTSIITAAANNAQSNNILGGTLDITGCGVPNPVDAAAALYALAEQQWTVAHD